MKANWGPTSRDELLPGAGERLGYHVLDRSRRHMAPGVAAHLVDMAGVELRERARIARSRVADELRDRVQATIKDRPPVIVHTASAPGRLRFSTHS